LTTYEVFNEEKRPFFLEGKNIFQDKPFFVTLPGLQRVADDGSEAGGTQLHER